MKKKYLFQKSNQRLKDFFFKKILSGLKKVLPVALLFAAMEVKPQPWTFTTCGATGQNGPSQAQANTAYTLTNLSGSVNVTGGIQSFTVPTSGIYSITAVGAQGGYNGGHGAFICGNFSLTAGDVLKILVGQKGVQGINNTAISGSGGGGGGSFVLDASNNPLVVAGGGGGNADGYGSASGGSGSTSGAVTSGMDAAITQNGAPFPSGANGGTGGNGGVCISASDGAGGGAGINGDGALCSFASPQAGTAALSFVNGGTGGDGASYNCATCTGFGGFGGGGGGYDSGSGNRGGGGGGYSGGGGGVAITLANGDQAGGGGGSYNGGANPLNMINSTGGDGAVYINLAQACAGTPTSNGLSAPPPFCPGVGGTMSFTNITAYAGFTGITFQWYFSTVQAGPFTAIPNATSTSYYTGTSLTSSSTPWFMATVSCSNSPTTTSLAAVQVTVNSFINCYCSSMASYTSDEEIYNVMLNGNVTNPLYSFGNGCNTPAPGPGSQLSQYSNFASLGTFANVFLGGSINTFSVAEDECDGPTYWDNGMAIYIDFNQNGSFSDPGEDVYVETSTFYGPRNVSGLFVVPAGATPGLTGMRVIVAEGYGPSWNPLDPCLNYDYGETEDYVVNLIMPPACSGAPVSSNIIGAATPSVCPGTNLTLGLSAITSYSNLGITFQWYESTSGTAGSYNAVSGATSPFYGIAPSSDTYYMAEITCGAASVSTAPQSVFMYTPVVSQVPYLETFEGLLADNTLPNCQWSTTSPLGAGSNISTHTSPGSNFYEDNHTPSGSMYATMNYGTYDSFYSNGIQMYAGVTYSAAMWYITDGYGLFNTLSLEVNSSQSSGGQIINQVGDMVNTSYSALSGTFTVPADGIYYMSVDYDDSFYYSSSISWDDLSVTIPCSENPAVFNLLGPSEVCSGTSYTLAIDTAGVPLSNLLGASSYTWNTGAQTASIVTAITAPAIYTALGTNSLGCIGTHTIAVGVNPIPVISIMSVPDPICAGQPVHLIAIGNANTYTWSTSANNNTVSIIVSPSVSTTYTVTGTSGDGCKNSTSQLIVVSQAPIINALSSEGTNTICAGDGFNLQATGNPIDSYTWTSGNNVLMLGQNINVIAPNVTTTYTVLATSAEGCIGSTMVTQSIYVCTGIETITATQGMNVYPNPNNGAFTIELNNGVEKNINLMDITGRIVLSNTTSQDKTEINISELANGIYYLKVQSNGASQIVKIVKQ